jgi:hypothetical protein
MVWAGNNVSLNKVGFRLRDDRSLHRYCSSKDFYESYKDKDFLLCIKGKNIGYFLNQTGTLEDEVKVWYVSPGGGGVTLFPILTDVWVNRTIFCQSGLFKLTG